MWTSMKWFEEWRKRRVIASYRKKLRRKLHELYGVDRFYSPGRVRWAAAEAGVNQEHIHYAYAMYCTPERYEEAVADTKYRTDACPPGLEVARREVREPGSFVPMDWSYGGNETNYGDYDGGSAGPDADASGHGGYDGHIGDVGDVGDGGAGGDH
jgi:hypothetical protein